MKLRSFLFLVLAVVIAGISTANCQESVPKLINYQGKLTDSTGDALANGEYSVRFELFDAPQDGTPIWGETRAVTLVSGVFNVALGGVGSEPVADTAVNDLGFAFGSAERYLQTTVVSGPGVTEEQTLLPRQQMTSVPFAVEASNGVPPGTVVPFFGVNAPPGWIMCAGQPLPREGYYARLFAAIGTSCGAPDGETFNVPDLRGRFLRGVDDPDGTGEDFLAAGLDPDAGLRGLMRPGGATGNSPGSIQSDGLATHTHAVVVSGNTNNDGAHRHDLERTNGKQTIRWGDGGGSSGDKIDQGQNLAEGADGAIQARPSGSEHSHAFSGAGSTTVTNGGLSETRPTNAACNFIIKY